MHLAEVDPARDEEEQVGRTGGSPNGEGEDLISGVKRTMGGGGELIFLTTFLG